VGNGVEQHFDQLLVLMVEVVEVVVPQKLKLVVVVVQMVVVQMVVVQMVLVVPMLEDPIVVALVVVVVVVVVSDVVVVVDDEPYVQRAPPTQLAILHQEFVTPIHESPILAVHRDVLPHQNS